MLNVRIEGLDELKRGLSDMGARQVPFAAAVAITRTARTVEQRLQQDMAGAFQSASPFVKRATFSTSANKANLEATVGIKDQKPAGGTAPAVLLREHFIGGARGNKPFEKALIAMGALPSGWRAVPGKGMPLDSYGNPKRKDVGEMLGALRSRIQVYSGKGKRQALIGYFIVPVGAHSNLHPGVYRRIGRSAIATMFIFVKQAGYRKVLDLQRSASEIVARDFQQNFDKAFTDAMRTAR